MAPTTRKELMLECVLDRHVFRVVLAQQQGGDWTMTFRPKRAKNDDGEATVTLSAVYARAMLKKAGLLSSPLRKGGR